MLNTSLVEFFDEILGGLLQSKHFDALIADQLDDGLRVGLPLIYVEGHDARIGVAGVGGGYGHGVLRGLGKRIGRVEERILSIAIACDCGSGNQCGKDTS